MPALDATFAGAGDDRQTIRCIYCNQPQQVSHRAMTLNCKFCHKLLKVEAITIADYQARRAIETCGAITIEKRGNVFSDRLMCGSLVVRGRLRGNVVSRGPVLVGAEAEVKGDITAPSVAVGEGAVVEGNWRIG